MYSAHADEGCRPMIRFMSMTSKYQNLIMVGGTPYYVFIACSVRQDTDTLCTYIDEFMVLRVRSACGFCSWTCGTRAEAKECGGSRVLGLGYEACYGAQA